MKKRILICLVAVFAMSFIATACDGIPKSVPPVEPPIHNETSIPSPPPNTFTLKFPVEYQEFRDVVNSDDDVAIGVFLVKFSLLSSGIRNKQDAQELLAWLEELHLPIVSYCYSTDFSWLDYSLMIYPDDKFVRACLSEMHVFAASRTAEEEGRFLAYGSYLGEQETKYGAVQKYTSPHAGFGGLLLFSIEETDLSCELSYGNTTLGIEWLESLTIMRLSDVPVVGPPIEPPGIPTPAQMGLIEIGYPHQYQEFQAMINDGYDLAMKRYLIQHGYDECDINNREKALSLFFWLEEIYFPIVLDEKGRATSNSLMLVDRNDKTVGVMFCFEGLPGYVSFRIANKTSYGTSRVYMDEKDRRYDTMQLYATSDAYNIFRFTYENTDIELSVPNTYPLNGYDVIERLSFMRPTDVPIQ